MSLSVSVFVGLAVAVTVVGHVIICVCVFIGLAVAVVGRVALHRLDESPALPPQVPILRSLRRHDHRYLMDFHQILHCLLSLHRCLCAWVLPFVSESGQHFGYFIRYFSIL